MTTPLITVEGVTKKFPKNYSSGAKSGLKKILKTLVGIESVFSGIKPNEFISLDNVSFTVKRGEAIGLLGKNGAGKSTILKHLTGIYLPDTGTVQINGHIEALIELGAGFHPHLSGRENIKQRTSILGLGKESSEKLLQEIIDFSELGEFIDMPVKNYSSGMQARLGFASAVLTKPDILLVDEVLSVGDFEFRQKCLSKINELKDDTAIILVSHSMQTLSMFCTRGLIVEHGKIIADLGIVDAIKLYMANEKPGTAKDVIDHRGEEFLNSNLIESHDIEFQNSDGTPTTIFDGQDLNLRVRIKFKSAISSKDLIFGIPVWAEDGSKISSISSDKEQIYLPLVDNQIDAIIRIRNVFNTGKLLSCFALVKGPEYLLRIKLPMLTINKYHPREQGYISLEYSVTGGFNG